MQLLFTIAIVFGALALFAKKPAITKPEKLQFDDSVFEKYGGLYGINPILLRAVAYVESSWNPSATNPDDPSYGLMQILCKPDGSGGCSNHFEVDDWPPWNFSVLYDPDYNVKIGAQILKWNIDQYGFYKGIAVYNSWTARNDPEHGPFSNQEYVDKVLGAFIGFGGLPL